MCPYISPFVRFGTGQLQGSPAGPCLVQAHLVELDITTDECGVLGHRHRSLDALDALDHSPEVYQLLRVWHVGGVSDF